MHNEMFYHITETKLEISVAASYHRKHITYEIHRRMTVVQSIIKEEKNNNTKDSHKASQEDVALHTPPLK